LARSLHSEKRKSDCTFFSLEGQKKKQVVIPLSLHRLFLEPPNRSPIALRERKRKGKIAAAAGRSAMPDTGAKRKSREGGVREGDGEGDGEGDAFAEVQAWLDTVPLISVAPPKQVRAG
jgi:hypothetical protein